MKEMASIPLVSIIIPCRDEAPFIDECLESVFHFDDIPGGVEVIVVDGMSIDGTRQMLSDWSKKFPNLRVLDNPKQIVPTALNIGIREARGEKIVRLDAHSIYPKNYIVACLETSRQTKAENVGGVVFPVLRRKTIQALLVQAITTHRFGVGNSAFRTESNYGPVDTVPFGCYRRDVFARIGYFDERLIRNQDYEFNRRIIQSGGKVWCNPSIVIEYYNQETIFGLLKQAYLTGRWNPWMWAVAPYTFTLRHAIPTSFVLSLAGVILFNILSPLGWILILAILFPYMILAAAASINRARRYGWKLLYFLPFLFFVYHTVYGFGALNGLLALALRRAPVQRIDEPWPGAGRIRTWPH